MMLAIRSANSGAWYLGDGRWSSDRTEARMYHSGDAKAALEYLKGHSNTDPKLVRVRMSKEAYEDWVVGLWEDGGGQDGLDLRGLFICCTGLAGEVGEVLEPIKKNIRDGRPIDKVDLANELGDVLYYLTRIARHYGLTLDDVMTTNHEKLSARYERT
jgi:NTP pyrophosphatase (non-canonical NTP hydrolase)